MSFGEKLFGWHLGKNESDVAAYVHIFSVWHFVALAIIAAAITAICLVARKKSEEWQKRMFFIIALILLALEILRIIYRTVTYCNYEKYLPDCRNIYNWAEIISFALCTMITFFTIVTLLINRPKWNAFAYDSIFVIGLLGGASALIYPDMLNTYYPIYHIMNVQTLITHGTLILVSALLIVTGRLKLNIKNCWKPFVTISCFAVIARIFSVLSGSSFMYMNGFELLPGFADKPLYAYLWILVLAFILWDFLCHLPSLIINAVQKKKNLKE